MSAIKYTAKRKLISSHSAYANYSFDVGMSVITPRDKPIANPSVALSGATETLFHRIDEMIMATTVPLNDLMNGEYHLFREFAHSVADGTPFHFDAYGTIANPVELLKVILEPNTYRVARVANISGSSAGTWTASLTMRVLP